MEIIVQKRELKNAEGLRNSGLIPAELYGRAIANEHFAVPAKEFTKIFKEAGSNTIITLVFGNEKRPVVIQDVQRGSLDQEIRHVDFYQVRLDEKIKAKVPLEFIGEAPAVKAQGGVLNRVMGEIEVEALPSHIPHRIEVSLAGLIEIGSTVYVKDLKFPPEVKVMVEDETAVASISAPKEEEVIAPVADVSEVKVETEEKKEERTKKEEQA
jgi:large subunit ribosomal protein L25